MIYPYLGVWPEIADDAFIAPNATIIGDVKIGSGSSIWFGCVLRGDAAGIVIGKNSNLQDHTIVHGTEGAPKIMIGDDVLIGHRAIIHGANLETFSFVGMAATLLDDVVVEGGGMVAAGAMVTPGKRIKSGEVWGGTPAKFLRPMKQEETDHLPHGTENYRRLGSEYIDMLREIEGEKSYNVE